MHPSHVGQLTVRANFRGATYVIRVNNPAHVCHGIEQVTVDGRSIAGNVLPIFGDQQTHQVQVVMG